MAFQQSRQSSIGRRRVPGTVRAAAGLMVAGGLVQMLRSAMIISHYVSAKAGDDPKSTAQAVVAVSVITTCGVTALWFWMAVKCQAGRDWARVTATVFFVLQVLSLFVPIDSSFGTNALTRVLGFITFGIGLAAVVLLWTRDSSRYF